MPSCVPYAFYHTEEEKQKVQLWPVSENHLFRSCSIKCETAILVHEVWPQYALTAKVLMQIRYTLLK